MLICYVNVFQVLLITDGSTGIGEGSLKHSLSGVNRDPDDGRDKFPLPFPFKCKLHVLCIAPQSDPALPQALPLFNKLLGLNTGEGELHIPDGGLTLKSTQAMFTRLCEKYFSPMDAVLCCGNLRCKVLLFPAPEIYDKYDTILNTVLFNISDMNCYVEIQINITNSNLYINIFIM